MDIVRGGGHPRWRQFAHWAGIVALAAVLIALTVALGTSWQPTTSAVRDSRSNVVEVIAPGRPRAYHSTSGPGCTNAVLLRKTGRVCLDPGHGKSRNDRTSGRG